MATKTSNVKTVVDYKNIYHGKPGQKGSIRISVYADGQIRLTGMKNPAPVGVALGRYDKGFSRKVRKALHKAGYTGLAGAKRVS